MISLVIPIRDRSPLALEYLLISARTQTVDSTMEILLVDGGSGPLYWKQYEHLAYRYGTNYHHLDLQYWNKPLTLNYGIRNTAGDPILAVDADMVMMPRTVERITEELDTTGRPVFTVVRTWAMGKFLGFGAIGGLQAASRKWFTTQRGYDERFFLWGSSDTDIFFRAVYDPMTRVIFFTGGPAPIEITDRCKQYEIKLIEEEDIFLLHQYHVPRDLDDPLIKLQWDHNRVLRKRLLASADYGPRNDDTWGKPKAGQIVLKRSGKHGTLKWEKP